MVGAGRAWRGPGDDDWGRPLEWRHAASPALHLGCLRPLGAGAVAVRGAGIGVCAAGACLGLGAPVLGRWRIGLGAIAGRSDRKSTRLNSSHLVISYAVFCLKKKTVNRICDR